MLVKAARKVRKVHEMERKKITICLTVALLKANPCFQITIQVSKTNIVCKTNIKLINLIKCLFIYLFILFLNNKLII